MQEKQKTRGEIKDKDFIMDEKTNRQMYTKTNRQIYTKANSKKISFNVY